MTKQQMDIPNEQEIIDALRTASSGNMAAWGKQNGFSKQYVFMVLNHIERPSDRMAACLGIQRIVRKRSKK